MRAYRLWAVVAIVAGLATLPGRVWAQSDTGSIDGRVFDESKAPIPGAAVTARNTATGLTRTATTSASGTYHVASLPAGRYDITSELAGFSTQIQQGVDVQVASATTVDFTLKVATVAETITVTGEARLIQTTTSDIGQVITSKMVENIPLNGRKFQDLSLLVPGTRQANYYDPTKTEVGGISYGGMTGRSVIINVDGGDNNDGVVRGLLQQFTADAIQEYKVTTQRYSAEFGRSVGGVVNVITKSGTNEFHGTGFVFARDQRLNSLNFFQKKQAPDRRLKGLPEKPPFKQQQFGGTLGGPIEKDKSHFFVAYERNRRDDFATVDTGGVLRGEEGDFAQPFRNHLLTTKLDFALGPNNNLIARYSLEDQKRDHDFIGGNTLKTAGATNTNKIHSGILKNTTVLGHNKLN
jgi:outer membrane receptor for ferrienterochelin and colicin